MTTLGKLTHKRTHISCRCLYRPSACRCEGLPFVRSPRHGRVRGVDPVLQCEEVRGSGVWPAFRHLSRASGDSVGGGQAAAPCIPCTLRSAPIPPGMCRPPGRARTRSGVHRSSCRPLAAPCAAIHQRQRRALGHSVSTPAARPAHPQGVPFAMSPAATLSYGCNEIVGVSC